MSKPTSLPRWGTNLATPGDIVEPLETKKDIGWQGDEAPPHSYMNWIHNVTYLWTVWLNAFESTAHSWTAAQTFSSGLVMASNLTQTSGTAQLGATSVSTLHTSGAVDMSASSVEVADLTIDGGLSAQGGGFFDAVEFHSTVVFDDGFSAGDHCNFSVGISVSSGVTTDTLTASAATTLNGTLSATSAVSLSHDNADPVGANQANGRAVHKAHCLIALNGTASPAFATDKYNIASIAIASSEIVITYTVPLAGSTNTVATVTLEDQNGTSLIHARISSNSNTAMGIKIRDNSGALLNPASALSGQKIHVHVEGRQ